MDKAILLSTAPKVAHTHRPLMIWATPRSVSTAFQKCFSAIDGAKIVHEPYTHCYYFSSNRQSDRYGSQPSNVTVEPEDVNRAMTRFFQSPEHSFVASKELAFQGEPYVSDRVLQYARHVLITRTPTVTYRSLVKLKPDFTEDEFGFTALERIHNRIKRFQSRVPVIDGSEFRSRPDLVLQRVSDFLGIDYSEKMLNWESGNIRKWDDHETQCQAKWHRMLESSTTILPERPRAEDIDVSSEHVDILARANMIYQALLKDERF